MRSLFLLSSLAAAITLHAAAPLPASVAFPGGPPTIRIADKSSGTITLAEWNATQRLTLGGCVPSARVVDYTVCIRNCKGADELFQGKADVITPAIKKMVANLPPDVPFTISVKVVDGDGKTWEVPKATYSVSTAGR